MASIQATHELVGGWRWVAPSGHQWRVEGERAHELGLCHVGDVGPHNPHMGRCCPFSVVTADNSLGCNGKGNVWTVVFTSDLSLSVMYT